MGEFGRRGVSSPTSDSGNYPSICYSFLGTKPSLSPNSWANWAYTAPFYWDESGQETTVLDIMSRAKALKIPYFLQWMLWDNSPPTPVPTTDPAAQVIAIGYSPNAPKDIFGGIATSLGLVSNGDMENVSIRQTKPFFWLPAKYDFLVFRS